VIPANAEAVALAAELIEQGELVVIPTETVYGIACDAFNPAAIERICEIKGRGSAKRISWLVADSDVVRRYADIPHDAERWLDDHNTVVLSLRSGTGTQGFRIPAHEFSVQMLRKLGNPVACTSANLSGEAPATNAVDASAVLGADAAAIIDGGECEVGIASRVADFSSGECKILR
jgi:tRNA threonylcarbamoyl adenosine modification protein (Sua5/YciO/YrdC/YwlC family)